MPRKLFFVVLAIVVIPVSMTCWKIVQYARVSKAQIFDLHRHIVHALSLNTTTYFHQLNMRLAFAPLMTRTPVWAEQLSVLNNQLLSNSDFACVALLDNQGKEKVKAWDGNIPSFRKPLDYSTSPFFQRVRSKRQPDTGAVYEIGRFSFFDLLYPLDNGMWILVAVRWETLKNLLFDQQVGKEGFIWLLDESGRVIGDSQKQRVGESYEGWAFFKDRLVNREEWMGEFRGPDKIAYVGAGSWVRGSGWFILSGQPQSEAYSKIYSLRRSAFWWMFSSFVGMLWFGYFWVKHISFPITRLSEGVNRVAERKFDESVPEEFGLEEFRALGEAFNRMTQELRAYEALQVEKVIEEHTTVQSLLLSIHDGILMLDEHRRIIFANEPARHWTLDVSLPAKDFDTAWKNLQEYPPWITALEPVLMKQKSSILEEFEFPVRGRSKWARVLAQEVRTERGRYLGVMIVIRDITRDKELDRMKEDFFNGITHDLRTPLAATIGYLGLTEVQLSEPDSEMGRLVLSARQSAKRALGLVETILSLARLQAGKLQLQKVMVQAHGLVSKIAHEMSFFAKMKKIEIAYACPDADLFVQADEALIERVLENLVGNAIKYTKENGRVEITAQAVENGVEFAIQDNGRGIDPEALKTLFGKFQQVKAEDRSVGFGIGLSFSKGIIEAHGSTIQVESQVGKGSRFSFVLERAVKPQQIVAA